MPAPVSDAPLAAREIPALSFWQPWAILTVVADPHNRRGDRARPPKEFETRPWEPPAKYIGRRFAIHATANAPRPVRAALFADENAYAERWRAILLRCGILPRDPYAPGYAPREGFRMATGAVIGSAVLEYVVGVDRALEAITAAKLGAVRKDDAIRDEFLLGDYTPGRFAWKLTAQVMLPTPIPYKGGQRFWMTPPHIAEAIRRSVALAGGDSGLAGAVVR